MTFNRDYCPYCGEDVQRKPDDYLDECPEHGVLEGLSDEEWGEIAAESGNLEKDHAP